MEAEKELTLSEKREYYEKIAAIGMPDAKDIIEKMQIARNVVRNHHKNIVYYGKNKESPIVMKTMLLSGANVDTVKAVMAQVKKTIRFYDLNVTPVSPNKDIEFLRDIITELYVEKLVVPKIKQIIEWIHEPRYKTRYLLDDLNSLGYVWRRLPGTDAGILIENPEQLHNRINYLKKIIEYRSNGRCLVFASYTSKKPASKEDIELNKYSQQGYSRLHRRAFAASPSLGLLNWTCYPSEYSRFEIWFRNVLLHLLPKSCVVVVNSQDILGSVISKVPTSSSAKSEMIKWLQAENIPHNPSWHRAELYKLVEVYKPNVQELKAIEEYTKTSGHDFLLAPELMPAINFYNNIIETNMMHMKPEEWLENDAKLAQREVKIYENSIKFEKIIDQIFTMATYTNVEFMCEKFEKYSSVNKEDINYYKDYFLE